MNQQLTDFFANVALPSLVDDATTGLGAVRPPHISRRGNRFTLVDGAGNTRPVETLHVDVIIVGVNKNRSKMFFEGPYKEDSNDPPACWSDNGIGPSAMATKPQSTTCSLCPHDVWGSSVSNMTGANTRACGDHKKIAVIVVGDDSNQIYEFVIKAGSFGDRGKDEMGWTRYVQSIKGFMIGDKRADLYHVVTRIAFVPNAMGVLHFKPIAMVDQAGAQRVIAAIQSGTIPQITGMTDVPHQGPVAPKPIAQEAPKQIAAAPVVSPPAEKRPPGRPRKIEPQGDPGMPPFLRREQAVAPTPQPISEPKNEMPPPNMLQQGWAAQVGAPIPQPKQPEAPPVQFGIATKPPAPDNQLQAALSKAFQLPTG